MLLKLFKNANIQLKAYILKLYSHPINLFRLCRALERTQLTHFKDFNERRFQSQLSGWKIINSPHILIAHAFSLDGTCRPICTYSNGYWRLICHLKKENRCLEDTRSIYMYSISRTAQTGSSNSISPKRQEWKMKRRWVKFWIMLLDCWTLRIAKTNGWVCIY